MKDHDLEGGDDGMYSNNDTENIFESFEESTLFIDRSLKSYTFIYFSKNIGYSICYSRTLIKFQEEKQLYEHAANKTCDWNGLLCLVNSSGQYNMKYFEKILGMI